MSENSHAAARVLQIGLAASLKLPVKMAKFTPLKGMTLLQLHREFTNAPCLRLRLTVEVCNRSIKALKALSNRQLD
ncbi:hypothetical protein [Phormidesmis sp. 146-33]